MERRRSIILFLLCSFCIGMWLIGCSSNDDPAGPEGPGNPCESDPCEGTPNAVPDTCTSIWPTIYSCECEDGYFWDQGTTSCPEDLCEDDPSEGIPNADPNSCTMPTITTYACDCFVGLFWDALTESCEDPCDPDPCALIGDAEAGTCNGLSVDDFTCG